MALTAYFYAGVRYKTSLLRKEILDSRQAQGILKAAARISGRDVFGACQEKRYFADTVECFVVTLAAAVAASRIAVGQPDPSTTLVGHSFGHYPALVTAGSLDYEEALAHVQRSGKVYDDYFSGFKHATLLVSGMALETVARLGEGVGEFAVTAHADGNAVIGRRDDLKGLKVLLEANGASAEEKPLRIPYHSRMVAYPAGQNADNIKKLGIRPPLVPFLSSYTGEYLSLPEDILRALREQWVASYRLRDTMLKLVGAGFRSVIEISASGFREARVI